MRTHKDFWAAVKRAKDEVKKWPKWKRDIYLGSKPGKVRPINN